MVRVLGPSDLPSDKARGLVLAQSGNAARFVVIYDSDPLAAQAIDNVRPLQERAPRSPGRRGCPRRRWR